MDLSPQAQPPHESHPPLAAHMLTYAPPAKSANLPLFVLMSGLLSTGVAMLYGRLATTRAVCAG